LLVHRLVKQALGFAPLPEATIEAIAGEIEERSLHASERERHAADAERRMHAIKAARFMAARLGRVLAARVSGVAFSGLFVTLVDAPVEGFLPVSLLPRDRYEFLDYALTGQMRGMVFTLGDDISVRAVSADPFRGEVVFAWERGMGKRRSR
jgi:ribonuclease R